MRLWLRGRQQGPDPHSPQLLGNSKGQYPVEDTQQFCFSFATFATQFNATLGYSSIQQSVNAGPSKMASSEVITCPKFGQEIKRSVRIHALSDAILAQVCPALRPIHIGCTRACAALDWDSCVSAIACEQSELSCY